MEFHEFAAEVIGYRDGYHGLPADATLIRVLVYRACYMRGFFRGRQQGQNEQTTAEVRTQEVEEVDWSEDTEKSGAQNSGALGLAFRHRHHRRRRPQRC